VRRAGKANHVQGREGAVMKIRGGMSLTAKCTVWYVLLCAKGDSVLY
jgi:hypothetical protein